jgi:hypothetical protein
MWNVYLLTILSLVAFGGCVNGDSCGDYGSNECSSALNYGCEVRLAACRIIDRCINEINPSICEHAATYYNLDCKWFIDEESYYGGNCRFNCENLGRSACLSEDLKGICEWKSGSGCVHGPLTTDWDRCNGYTETCLVENYGNCEWRAGDCREKDDCEKGCSSYDSCKEYFIDTDNNRCKWDETAEIWYTNCPFYNDYEYECIRTYMFGICDWDGTQCSFYTGKDDSASSFLPLSFSSFSSFSSSSSLLLLLFPAFLFFLF